MNLAIHPRRLLIALLLTCALAPAQTAKKKHAAPKPAPKSKAAAHLHVYKTGHGNQGFGTLKTPPRYTAPLPAATGAAAIDYPSALESFFLRLEALQADPAQTVRVLQFGDSHTAADMFTGRMRSLFQQRFGDGGAGFTYAGHPFAGYRILGTSRAQSAGWTTEGVRFTQIVDTDLGLGGVAQTSTHTGDSLWIDAPCTRMQLHYLQQPGGGAFSVIQDGVQVAEIATNATLDSVDESGPTTLDETCTSGVDHHFEVVAQSSAPVRLFGFVTEQPGITYEALGLNGAEAGLILRWNQAIFTQYLRERDPGLIILAYGTNEAGNHNWTYENYRGLLGRIVDSLHATAPSASILVIGPPDRSLRSGRGRRAAWTPFPQTMHISDAQRDTCRTHGCAFWSWRDRMGGLGSMNHWVSNGLAQPDHTHFNSAGYVKLADGFYSDIIAAYNAWKLSQATSTLTPHASSPNWKD